MAWSLFARRFTISAVASRPATLSVAARRTLFATPRFNFSEPSEGATAEEKASKGKRATPAKRGRGRPAKNPAETHQEKQSKQEKQRVRIPASLKPPKRAPGPYFLFYASFAKSQPQASTLQEAQELSKRAGEVWRGYSMAEKQPFYDENEARKAQAKQEREEFFSRTSLTDLKQLNAIRKAQGKTKFHATKRPSTSATPFILFSNEFRSSPEGQAAINETSPEKKYTIRAVLAAAERWRSMSAEDKAPYFERFKQAKEDLKAEHAQS